MNHYKTTQSLRLSVAIKLAAIVMLITLLALGFIVENTTVKHLAEELSKKERQLAEIRDRIRVKQEQVARLQSPELLQKRIVEFNLNLLEIQQEQIVRLYEDASADKRPTLMNFAQTGVKPVTTAPNLTDMETGR